MRLKGGAKRFANLCGVSQANPFASAVIATANPEMPAGDSPLDVEASPQRPHIRTATQRGSVKEIFVSNGLSYADGTRAFDNRPVRGMIGTRCRLNEAHRTTSLSELPSRAAG
jgi:hypothetical protein